MTLQAAKSKRAITLAMVDSTSTEAVRQILLQKIYSTCFLEGHFQQVFVFVGIIMGVVNSEQ